MTAPRKVALAMLAIGWPALAVAAVAALFAPTSFCIELGVPAAVTTSHVALVIAVVAAGVAVVATLAAPPTRSGLLLVGVTVPFLIAVWAFTWHVIPSSFCG